MLQYARLAEPQLRTHYSHNTKTRVIVIYNKTSIQKYLATKIVLATHKIKPTLTATYTNYTSTSRRRLKCGHFPLYGSVGVAHEPNSPINTAALSAILL